MFFADLTDQWCGCTLAHRTFAAELSCFCATCRFRPEDNLPACLGRRASCPPPDGLAAASPSNRDRLYCVHDKRFPGKPDRLGGLSAEAAKLAVFLRSAAIPCALRPLIGI